MIPKVVFLAALFGLLAITLAANPSNECDCGTISSVLQSAVLRLFRFLSGLVYGATKVVGCSLSEVLDFVIHLIYLTVQLLHDILQLPLPQLPPEQPYNATCEGLKPILEEFYKLVGDVIGEAATSNACNCPVPGLLSKLPGMLADLLDIIRKLRGGLLGGLLGGGGIQEQPVGVNPIIDIAGILHARGQ